MNSNQGKLLLLADADSIHTYRWATALHSRGYEVSIFSLVDPGLQYPDDIQITSCGIDAAWSYRAGSLQKVFIYLRHFTSLKRFLNEVSPDLLHAHYASSYGLLGAMCNFNPFVLSVWGADVYTFPRISFLHRSVLRWNLKRADSILSTSKVMAKEINKYTYREVMITPFGVDTNRFRKSGRKDGNEDFTIGTIKALEHKYGIEVLIDAFRLVVKRTDRKDIKLVIAGKGSLENELKRVVSAYGISGQVEFTGRIPHDEVPAHLNTFDIYMALSIDHSESFGVAIIEASACGIPVIVTDVGGLPEVVENNVTGIVVPPHNATAAADAVIRLIQDEDSRVRMGENGVKHIEKYYSWDDNVELVSRIYKDLI